MIRQMNDETRKSFFTLIYDLLENKFGELVDSKVRIGIQTSTVVSAREYFILYSVNSKFFHAIEISCNNRKYLFDSQHLSFQINWKDYGDYLDNIHKLNKLNQEIQELKDKFDNMKVFW